MTHGQGSMANDSVTAREEAVLRVSNEFTAVEVRVVKTRNGTRLRISSLRLDSFVDLDPLALESLTWQSSSIFSDFLSTPFGDLER
jgi:hypothetical protein